MSDTKLTSLAHINTLWELLELALGDLEQVEKDERYVVLMSFWHSPVRGVARRNLGEQKCAVCLAGSVLARTFHNSPEVYSSPYRCGDDDTIDRLEALDSLRDGFVGWAYKLIHGHTSQAAQELDRKVVDYGRKTRDQWWTDMRKLLADLKAANL